MTRKWFCSSSESKSNACQFSDMLCPSLYQGVSGEALFAVKTARFPKISSRIWMGLSPGKSHRYIMPRGSGPRGGGTSSGIKDSRDITVACVDLGGVLASDAVSPTILESDESM